MCVAVTTKQYRPQTLCAPNNYQLIGPCIQIPGSPFLCILDAKKGLNSHVPSAKSASYNYTPAPLFHYLGVVHYGDCDAPAFTASRTAALLGSSVGGHRGPKYIPCHPLFPSHPQMQKCIKIIFFVKKKGNLMFFPSKKWGFLTSNILNACQLKVFDYILKKYICALKWLELPL